MQQRKKRLPMLKSLVLTTLVLGINFSLFASDNSEQGVIEALEAGKIVVAKERFSNLTKVEKNTISGKILHSRILFREDNTEDSYELLEALSEDNKDNAEVYYYFGRSAIVMAQKVSIFSKLSYASEALESWEHALSLNPEHIETLEGLIGFHLGAPSIAGGDIEKGLAYAKTLLTLDSEKGYANLAKVYWQQGKSDLAEKAIADGLAITPNSVEIYFTQGSVYSGQAKENSMLWKEARVALNKALEYAKSAQEKQHVLYQLGKIAVNSGEEIQAGIIALEQMFALQADQYQQWGRYRLAQLYLNNNQPDKAKDVIAKVEYQDDDELEEQVKSLAKKIKKAVKKQAKVS
ncbi:tetratricopeptide repeat protein [Colwellia sp. 1_MG-2023]|jgi:tetratricopeptide (TPR) repeat protein|uniref:tetratricopeptide repeat protein n=1 Tax=unclassified Colwellia TaxID=196834 RepID=UPI001C08F189|nr:MULTISPECIES: tetratricopeptide repeat protein [unclassified Colwellia]MBU2924062.1 tetratricopeptide repeat protein [Colwellia sp. C2M11]MDO6487894.1 tetratricopeptide repeat protein [Colwellia sp. 6_MG-2023]MDO6651952.1 tetratricopeptide repeat protein [Colwellia sp. 3_MG-2023]MDO6664728.1 tetratricopeptide repeat protein [Colwellia sp. 2_MG-2023]MDO6689230.1 tetratricopeptide repeat protein [Colwellia sp. 1_MG-2023]